MSLQKTRAYELDFLRGFAIVMMMLMHLAWDLRNEFGLHVFNFLQAGWFWSFVHPVFIVIFVGVSGICCTFSRNNLIRGLKLLGVAIAFTGVTWVLTEFADFLCLVIFNVLALLATGILLYSLVGYIERKFTLKADTVSIVLVLVGTIIASLGSEIKYMDYVTDNPLFLPVGFAIKDLPMQADYLPLIPWIGVFFIGCAVGRIFYAKRDSLLPAKSNIISKVFAPIEFIGRHSLVIYLIHQPIMYGILYLIFMILGKV